MVLTNFPHDPLLDLDPWVGQRSASYRFQVTNAVTGENMGAITPLRSANLAHDTSRTIKRQLTISLGVSDLAAINPLQDRVSVYMVFPDGTEYPLGRYMFTDASEQIFTSGNLGNMALNDEMFLVDQAITKGINGVGVGVAAVIQNVLSDLPVDFQMEASPFTSAEAWGVGTNRGTILESLAVSGDYWSPWFDNENILRFVRTFNPVDQIPDLDYDSGNQVMRSSIVQNSDLLTAPNTFLVISNNADNPDVEVVGNASVPPSAPNSIVNRGFEIAEVQHLQLSNSAQAQQVAQGLVNRQTIFERVNLTTAPDPRFDSYNVIYWRGDKWLDLQWSLTLVEGSPMNHTIRKSYQAG